MAGRTTRVILGTAAVIAVVVIAVVAIILIGGGSGEPSRDVDAPTLDVNSTQAGNTSGGGSSSPVLFSIVSEESEVRFSLDEELMGQPNRVIGTTNQVAGQINVDFANPVLSQIGTVRINVRTLATDSSLRDRAIRSQILRSAEDQFEFAEFVPTRLENMPGSIAIGEPFDFYVVGNLIVMGISSEVNFAVLVTAVNNQRIEGTAAATVQRTTYNLNIPQVPSVANVSNDVLLEIDFVAVPASVAPTSELDSATVEPEAPAATEEVS